MERWRGGVTRPPPRAPLARTIKNAIFLCHTAYAMRRNRIFTRDIFCSEKMLLYHDFYSIMTIVFKQIKSITAKPHLFHGSVLP